MLPGVVRSKHVEDIWKAMRASGVEGLSIQLKGVGPFPLTHGLLIEFMALMRGNKVDQLVGPWVKGLYELAGVRASVAAQQKQEGAEDESVDF